MTDTRQFLFSFMVGVLLPVHLLAIGNLSTSLETGAYDAGVLQDSMLFIATQRGIDIYNISDPYSPALQGSLDTPGICTHLVLSNGILAAADGGTIRLYSIADPVNPILLALYKSTRTFSRIEMRDSLIAAATIPNGVTLLTYAGSSIDSVSRIPFNEAVVGLAISDTLLIVGLANAGFTIYNIQDPSNPTLLLPPYPVPVNDLSVSDTILCCATGNYGVWLFNISDPLSPDSLSSYVPGDFIRSVMVADSLLCCSGFMKNLYVANISDPASPVHVHTFATLLIPVGSATDGEILYSPEGSAAELFSLSLHTTYASLDPLRRVTGAVLADSLAFVAVEGSGLAILDISVPQIPSTISWYIQTDTIEQVLVHDSLVFLSCGASGLSILNVSDPASPTHISSYNSPGTLHGTAKRGTILFLADGGSGLQTISISDISAPSFLDSVLLPGHSHDIVLTDSFALIALGPKGFALVLVKDPQNLMVVDTITDAGFSTCLATNGAFLFLGTQDESILIYDLVTWVTPQLIATYHTPGPVQDICFCNNLLFAACNDGGIQIIDVSDPFFPVCADSLDTPGISSDIHSLLGLIGTADRFSFRLDSFAFTDTIPPAPVSNLSLEAGDSLIILRWQNPGDADYKGSRVLFKNDTFPIHPDDGTVLLDHTMDPASPDSCFHTGLPGDSTRFYYAVYAYDLAQNFSFPGLISGTSASDTTPPGEVSQISFTFWEHLLEVRFMTPNDPDFMGVRALFDTTHIPQNIYDGDVFFDKPLYSNSTYAETLSVEHNRTYHFTFFSKDSVPNFSQGTSASFQTIDTIPPNEVSFQLIEFLNFQIRIVFRTPGDPDFVSIKACYDLTQPPQHPDSGELFFNDTLNQNTNYLRELSDVILDTTYYFTFFARDTALNFSPGRACTCITNPDTVPPDTVLQFTATQIFPDTVKFSWVNPPDSDFYYVRIRCDINTFPQTPEDGFNVKNKAGAPGQPDSIKWNPGIPGVRFNFAAFATDRWGNASQGVHAWCTTPTLTKIKEYDPVDGGFASWLDALSITFTAPIQQSTLQTGTELSGRHPYNFAVDRGAGNTYLLIPPSFASLDTITITLHNTILDSIGNPFDGDGDGVPDSVDDYSWGFFARPICDYTANDTINAEDFAVLRNALDTQDITKEVGPCSGSAPYYTLIPDSIVNFEDFALFIMMWNWSLDTRGIPLISSNDRDSLIHFQQRDTILLVNLRQIEHLIGGEIIIHDIGDTYSVRRGKGIRDSDLFLTRQIENDLLVSFGMMNEMNAVQIAIITVSSPLKSIDYSYRLVYDGATKEGKGTCMVHGSIPERTVLQSVHPNPGAHITIAFGIPKNMQVSIDLFDAAGRKVADLLSKKLQAGYHSTKLDDLMLREKLAAGIYFVRLKTEDASLVRKIILLR